MPLRPAFLLILLLCLVSPNWSEPAHPSRALLIGISDYQHQNVWPKLPGSLQDTRCVREFLTDPHGSIKLKPEAVTVIDQQHSTRAAIEEALEQLSREARPGETIYLHYSGHGGLLPSESSGESDSLDECLVPIDAPDFRSREFPAKVIRDKWLAAYLDRLADRVRQDGQPGSVLCVLDCCHSGGMSRAPGRLLRQAVGATAYFGAKTAPRETVSRRATHPGWVMLSACRYDQAAEETEQGGAFTLAFLKALQDSRLGPDANYYDLLRLIQSSPIASLQTPQAAGEREMRVFGGSLKSHHSWISVLERNGKQVVIDQGTLVGVTKGTEIGFYPLGTNLPKGEPLATVTVIEEGPFHSIASLKSDVSAPALSGTVGWVTRFPPQPPLTYQVKGPQPSSISRWLKVCFPGRVLEVNQGAELLFQQLPGRLRLVRMEDGSTLFDRPFRQNDLEPVLNAEIQNRFFFRIPSNDPDSLKLTFSPERPDNTYRLGESAEVKVENTGPEPLFVSVFYVDSLGEMQCMYPQPDQLAEWKKMGSADPPLRLRLDFTPPTGLDRLRVLATREPIDLNLLLSRAQRDAHSQLSAGWLLSSPILLRVLP